MAPGSTSSQGRSAENKCVKFTSRDEVNPDPSGPTCLAEDCTAVCDLDHTPSASLAEIYFLYLVNGGITQVKQRSNGICGLSSGSSLKVRRLCRPGTSILRRGQSVQDAAHLTRTAFRVVLSCGIGNHLDLRGLPGGAEGIRTDGHQTLLRLRLGPMAQ